MTHTDKLIGILTTSSLTDRVDFEGVKMQVALSKNGCSTCVFDTEEKANKCKYKTACMAHYRHDKKSVVFTSK